MVSMVEQVNELPLAYCSFVPKFAEAVGVNAPGCSITSRKVFGWLGLAMRLNITLAISNKYLPFFVLAPCFVVYYFTQEPDVLLAGD